MASEHKYQMSKDPTQKSIPCMRFNRDGYGSVHIVIKSQDEPCGQWFIVGDLQNLIIEFERAIVEIR